ncbi:hypothetical protein BGZ75_000386, partial [Mortierella antarctica]
MRLLKGGTIRIPRLQRHQRIAAVSTFEATQGSEQGAILSSHYSLLQFALVFPDLEICAFYHTINSLAPRILNATRDSTMAELDGFHLANILRMTQPPRSLARAATSVAMGNGSSRSSSSDENDTDKEDEDREVVMRALDSLRKEWQRNILDFKAKLSSKQKQLNEQVLSQQDFPPLEEEVEYGMENVGYTYKAPVWPAFEDSDDTETISDSHSLTELRDISHGQVDEQLPDYASIIPPVLPPHLEGNKTGPASSMTSVVYDRAWLISQCSTHLEAFGDPNTDMTSKRLSIDIFTILRSNKPDDDIQINLVDLLGFDNFEFITALLTNRRIIVDNVMTQ